MQVNTISETKILRIRGGGTARYAAQRPTTAKPTPPKARFDGPKVFDVILTTRNLDDYVSASDNKTATTEETPPDEYAVTIPSAKAAVNESTPIPTTPTTTKDAPKKKIIVVTNINTVYQEPAARPSEPYHSSNPVKTTHHMKLKGELVGGKEVDDDNDMTKAQLEITTTTHFS